MGKILLDLKTKKKSKNNQSFNMSKASMTTGSNSLKKS